MRDSNYLSAMFILDEKAEDEARYIPANTFAEALCVIMGKRTMNASDVNKVREHFRVIEPSGKPLPYPRQKVDVVA